MYYHEILNSIKYFNTTANYNISEQLMNQIKKYLSQFNNLGLFKYFKSKGHKTHLKSDRYRSNGEKHKSKSINKHNSNGYKHKQVFQKFFMPKSKMTFLINELTFQVKRIRKDIQSSVTGKWFRYFFQKALINIYNKPITR